MNNVVANAVLIIVVKELIAFVIIRLPTCGNRLRRDVFASLFLFSTFSLKSDQHQTWAKDELYLEGILAKSHLRDLGDRGMLDFP